MTANSIFILYFIISSQLTFADPMFDKGQKITTETKESIGKSLINALKTQKTIDALAFCNQVAIPLTSNNAKKSHTSIKRATDKARNPDNIANKDEMKYINLFKKDLEKASIPQAIIVSDKNGHHFYSPIITNNMCLQCHGEINTEIKRDVFERIKSLYPNDQATGYKTNELRGIFSIHWEN